MVCGLKCGFIASLSKKIDFLTNKNYFSKYLSVTLLSDIRQTFWQKVGSLVSLVAKSCQYLQKWHFSHIINIIHSFYENSPIYVILNLKYDENHLAIKI